MVNALRIKLNAIDQRYHNMERTDIMYEQTRDKKRNLTGQFNDALSRLQQMRQYNR